MKRAKRTIIIISLALAGCRGPIHAPTATPETISVRILATTTTYPLLQDLTLSFHRPGILLAVRSAAVNWDAVYNQLLAGNVPYALTTYLPSDAGMWSAPIGYDGVAIIVHATNTTPALSLADLNLIFRGQIATWAELGGPDSPVTVISREAGSDTRRVFETHVMGHQRITPAARLALSGKSMIDLVASIPGAVGYVSMAQVGDQVRMVPIRAQATARAYVPTPETVSQGDYPLRAPILVVGPQAPAEDSIYRDWFAWMQSENGQAIVGQAYGVLEF